MDTFAVTILHINISSKIKDPAAARSNIFPTQTHRFVGEPPKLQPLSLPLGERLPPPPFRKILFSGAQPPREIKNKTREEEAETGREEISAGETSISRAHRR